jgi:peptidoglycan/xylan/chitin deacetylase (PgdA/CDA1 family)
MHKQAGPALERVLVPMLFRAQLHRAARRLNHRKVVVVMYHGFTAADAHPGIENHEQKHVHVRTFVEHLAFLKRHYRVVPLDDVVRAYRTGAPLPDRAAVITIDDGYESVYRVAYPALTELQLPASVYVATEFVDERRFLWTDRVEYAVNRSVREALELTIGAEPLRLDLRTTESKRAADRRLRSSLKGLPQESRDAAVDAIEEAAGCGVTDAADGAALYAPMRWSDAAEMARSGLVTIGSHTHSHVILSRCAPARAADELRASKRIIESRLGMACDAFCYPNGRRGDFNASTASLVKAQGFTSALTTVYGMNGRGADVYALKRYNLGKPMLPGELDVRLSGLIEWGSVVRTAVTWA